MPSSPTQKPNQTILLVDGSNQFIRHYVAYSSTDMNGNPMGGVVGFLRSLSYFVHDMCPTQVIITFDAPGGSQRRRKLFSEYKAGRKPARLNRKFDIGAEKEQENQKAQLQRLQEYLKDLPVNVLCVPGIEADDAIAYCCLLHPKDRKIIVSNDQDFKQLLNSTTMIYRPQKREFYTSVDCLEEHQIHPHNFALARAITGDTSDNIKGIPRIGLKTLRKLLPQFEDSHALTVDEVLEFCAQQEGDKYKLFAQHKDSIASNYQLMQLRTPLISYASVKVIKENISEKQSMNATGIRAKMMHDGIDIGPYFTNNFLILNNRR